VRCTRRDVCPAFPAWVQAQAAVDRALAGTDLESLLRRQKPLRKARTRDDESIILPRVSAYVA